MTADDLVTICRTFMDAPGRNRVTDSEALRPELAGLRMYDGPLLGVARADDPLFDRLRESDVVGPQFRAPREWLPEAVSVVSLFLPYSREVIETNRVDAVWPSDEWLHARIEGQAMINRLAEHLLDAFRGAGHLAVAPALHPEFRVFPAPAAVPGAGPVSNWSERHVAFVAGLGTFGLSTAFITRRGAAGRLTSLVTSLSLPATARPYFRHDEYCNHCGACVRRCRHGALSKDGKDKERCRAFVEGVTLEKYRPRYGCGKCYVAVPCERSAPGA